MKGRHLKKDTMCMPQTTCSLHDAQRDRFWLALRGKDAFIPALLVATILVHSWTNSLPAVQVIDALPVEEKKYGRGCYPLPDGVLQYSGWTPLMCSTLVGDSRAVIKVFHFLSF